MYETKKCKYCKKDININYTVCPLCGGHLKDNVRSAAPGCPRCKVPLEIQVHDGDDTTFARSAEGYGLTWQGLIGLPVRRMSTGKKIRGATTFPAPQEILWNTYRA